jgi:hypothetical protein
VSFREINVVIKAHNEASKPLRTLAGDIASLGASAVAVAKLGQQFGVLDARTADAIATMGSFVALAATVARGIEALSSITKIASVVQWAFNAALAMKIALLTLGIGLVIATAAYMAWLATTTRDAAAAQRDYNAAVSEASTPSRSIVRSGDEALRRGIED